jgi:hypothetical protein
MDSHKNAPLTPVGRERLVRMVLATSFCIEVNLTPIGSPTADANPLIRRSTDLRD